MIRLEDVLSEDKIPATEVERQYYFIDVAKQILEDKEKEAGRKLTFCVNTFGCQMNARDSEKLIGILEQVGYVQADSEDADFVLYNTCTVRENANNKVYGHLGYLHNKKKKNPHMMIALCGCMMQEEHVVETIRKKYRFVDLVFGTHNIYKFAELLVRSLLSESMIVDIWKDTDQIVEDLPIERKYSFKSGVNIMFGCNNFCSYCIVPYVRGRERSRKPLDIIREIEKLVADGVVEVMLLGQNVNSYGKNLDEPVTFAQLLEQVEQIEGLERIRFMTSHPKDLSDELIEVLGRSKKVCKHLHLPLQSGSSKILQKMNRHYTKEDYLTLVDKIRAAVPDMAITPDIIVGFPGETEEEFTATVEFLKDICFYETHVFKYSRRKGTKADRMPDQIPEQIKNQRSDVLLALTEKNSGEYRKKLLGRTVKVLLEEESTIGGTTYMTGHTREYVKVAVAPETAAAGEIIDVKVTGLLKDMVLGE